MKERKGRRKLHNSSFSSDKNAPGRTMRQTAQDECEFFQRDREAPPEREKETIKKMTGKPSVPRNKGRKSDPFSKRRMPVAKRSTSISHWVRTGGSQNPAGANLTISRQQQHTDQSRNTRSGREALSKNQKEKRENSLRSRGTPDQRQREESEHAKQDI